MTILPDSTQESTSQTPNLSSKDVLLEAAQQAYERGWSVIPALRNKKPAIKWTAFQTTRMPLNDLEQQVARPEVTILGVVTGKLSGIFVLDADDDQSKAFCATLGLEPHAHTQAGGFHYYFKFPEGRVIKTLASKSISEDGEYKQQFGLLDVRGEGGYANFAGEGPKGCYQIVRDPTNLYDVSLLPDTLLRHIEKTERRVSPLTPGFSLTLPANAPSVGELLKRAATKVDGGRDHACFWLAGQLRDNGYSGEQARDAMQQFHTTLPDTDTKGDHDPFALETALEKVQRAYQQEPRQLWAAGPRFALTDIGNGERLADAVQDELRYTDQNGWMRWDGRRWQQVGEVVVEQVAKRVAKAMTQEAADLFAQARDTENPDAAKVAEAAAKRLMAYAMKSQDTAKVKAMIHMARSESALLARPEEFDQVPTVLNLLNGTLDLETGQLRPHNREDKLTRLVNLNYNSQADCPNWRRFLATITIDNGLN